MRRKKKAQPKTTPPPVLAALIDVDRAAASWQRAARKLAEMAMGKRKRGDVTYLRLCGAEVKGHVTASESPADLFSASARLQALADAAAIIVPSVRATYWEEQRKPKSKRARKIQPRKHARISVNTGRRK